MTPNELSSPIGLVAGSGTFPLEFARKAKEQGLEVIAIAHRGETDPDLESLTDKCTWIKVGQLGKLLKTLRRSGVQQAAFAGGIKKVGIFNGASLDLAGIQLIARLRSVKDDVLLRGVAGELEKFGIEVIPANILLDQSLPKEGLLTKRDLSQKEIDDALLGWEAAKGIGALEIGQGVVVYKGVVVAVEAIEGTDKMLARAGELISQSQKRVEADCPVLVKVSKPEQDIRLDLPTIGPKTIESMEAAGIGAVVVESERTILLDPVQLVEQADQSGIAIRVIEGPHDLRQLESA